jgi:hypothetical protein
MAHVMGEGRLFGLTSFRMGGVASRHDVARSTNVAFLIGIWAMAQIGPA